MTAYHRLNANFRLSTTATLALSTVLLFMLSGCAEDLQPQQNQGTNQATNQNQHQANHDDHGSSTKVTHDDQGDYMVTVVDATDDDEPVYVDLIDGDQVSGDRVDSTDWHLSFQRFAITVNGGVSGPGQVAAQIVEDRDFDAVDQAPEGTYFSDVDGEPDERGQNPGLVFQSEGTWYEYDPSDHTLTPRDRIYILHLDGEHFVKVQFLDYYDDAGTSGYPTFKWALIEAPDGDITIDGVDSENDESPIEGAFSVDASDGNAYVYVDLSEAREVSVDDPSDDTGWDVAISRTDWRLNGGVSGSAQAAAQPLDDALAFENVVSTSRFGFFADAMLSADHPPGAEPAPGNPALAAWYDYDMDTHNVSPAPGIFVLRLADGTYGKLQILSFDDGQYDLRFAPIESHSEIRALTVDASDDEAWVDLSLTHGQVIDSDEDTRAWDLRVRRTQIAANGGTSGDRGLAATFIDDQSIDDIEQAPTTGFEQDEEIAVAGPGGGTFSGNPVLSDWYDYDMDTHQLSPKAGTFVIRLADGGYAALAIESYDDGLFSLALAYTGPESLAF